MPEHDALVNTAQLNRWVDQLRAGDRTAADALLRAVCHHLERLARKMLRSFPSLQHWAQTDDVLQNALVRLLRALEQVRPHSVREFFGLAATQIRRELLDLARQFHGPLGMATHHQRGGLVSEAAVPCNSGESPEDLEKWCLFHQGVENLPPEERDVVNLIYYHSWPRQAVADLYGMSVRTVQRRWQSALIRLRAAFGPQEA